MPVAWRTRESSNESSGVPLASNLWTNPAAGSAKKTLPKSSVANATGASSLPGPSLRSPHEFRNSKGGGAWGFGAGSARLVQDVAQDTKQNAIKRNPQRWPKKSEFT